MKAVLLVVSLALLGLVSASFIDTVYTGTLTGAQLAPTPSLSLNEGVIVCQYVRNTEPKTLDCEVHHTILSATDTVIHLGERGISGPALYSFPVQSEGVFGLHFRHVFQLVDQLSYSVEEQESDFLNGKWYVTITSSDFIDGEIRGQLEHQDRFFARMSSEATIPIASGSTARGIGLATYTVWDPKRTLQVDILHNVLNPFAAEIRDAYFGTVGPLVHTFRSASNPIKESIRYTIGEEKEIFLDRHYINVLSVPNPNGEIRGQLETIDGYPAIALTARLEGVQVVPAVNTRARGCAIFAYDCDLGVMEYLVFHNVETPLGASIHAGNPGSSGSLFFDLARFQNPIFGSHPLNREEEFLFFSQQLYVSVTSLDNPTGELRGQITAEFDFFAYMSGTWVSPPVSTESVGCATFKLKDNRRTLSYSVHHDVSSPIGVEIAIGNVGQNGLLDKPLRRESSPIIGDDETMDDDELQRFLNDQMYVQVRSSSYPNGEIRGQINRITPCQVDRESTLTIDSEIVAPPPPTPIGVPAAPTPASPGATPPSPSPRTPNTFVTPPSPSIATLTFGPISPSTVSLPLFGSISGSGSPLTPISGAPAAPGVPSVNTNLPLFGSTSPYSPSPATPGTATDSPASPADAPPSPNLSIDLFGSFDVPVTPNTPNTPSDSSPNSPTPNSPSPNSPSPSNPVSPASPGNQFSFIPSNPNPPSPQPVTQAPSPPIPASEFSLDLFVPSNLVENPPTDGDSSAASYLLPTAFTALVALALL